MSDKKRENKLKNDAINKKIETASAIALDAFKKSLRTSKITQNSRIRCGVVGEISTSYSLNGESIIFAVGEFNAIKTIEVMLSSFVKDMRIDEKSSKKIITLIQSVLELGEIKQKHGVKL